MDDMKHYFLKSYIFLFIQFIHLGDGKGSEIKLYDEISQFYEGIPISTQKPGKT